MGAGAGGAGGGNVDLNGLAPSAAGGPAGGGGAGSAGPAQEERQMLQSKVGTMQDAEMGGGDACWQLVRGCECEPYQGRSNAAVKP